MLAFPQLAFALADAERRFPRSALGHVKAKNVSVDGRRASAGAAGAADDLQALRAMIVRFAG